MTDLILAQTAHAKRTQPSKNKPASLGGEDASGIQCCPGGPASGTTLVHALGFEARTARETTCFAVMTFMNQV